MPRGPFLADLLADTGTLGTLNGWLAAEGAAPARVLAGADLDLAVARGAAYYLDQGGDWTEAEGCDVVFTTWVVQRFKVSP